MNILGANFDQNKTASWTGEIILEASTSTPTAILNLETYTSDWKDLLPEQWRADARIDNLKVCLTLLYDATKHMYMIEC